MKKLIALVTIVALIVTSTAASFATPNPQKSFMDLMDTYGAETAFAYYVDTVNIRTAHFAGALVDLYQQVNLKPVLVDSKSKLFKETNVKQGERVILLKANKLGIVGTTVKEYATASEVDSMIKAFLKVMKSNTTIKVDTNKNLDRAQATTLLVELKSAIEKEFKVVRGTKDTVLKQDGTVKFGANPLDVNKTLGNKITQVAYYELYPSLWNDFGATTNIIGEKVEYKESSLAYEQGVTIGIMPKANFKNQTTPLKLDQQEVTAVTYIVDTLAKNTSVKVPAYVTKKYKPQEVIAMFTNAEVVHADGNGIYAIVATAKDGNKIYAYEFYFTNEHKYIGLTERILDTAYKSGATLEMLVNNFKLNFGYALFN